MKYFAISDIHSFYTPMIEALTTAGYNKENPDHFLIVCGDIFDRGDETKEVLDYLKSIPKERRVFIRGNHEYLMRDAIRHFNGNFGNHDYSNGTVKSLCHLTDIPIEYNEFYIDAHEIIRRNLENHKVSEVIEWTMSEDWVDYFELDRFIFVHCWIPVYCYDGLPMYYVRNRVFAFNPHWKEADSTEWEEATWGCPWVFEQQGLVPEGKTIVCGHWHTSDFHQKYNEEYNNYNIFYKNNLIALDACTALTGFCNVLVIDENFTCYDQYGNKLEEKEI